MPSLNINLTSSIVNFTGEEKTDEWRLVLCGKTERGDGYKSFEILGENHSWSGYGAEVRVFVEKRLPRTEAAGIPAEMPWVNHEDPRDKILVFCPDDHLDQPYFEISIWLPPDAFQRLVDVDWTCQEINLYVSTPLPIETTEHKWALIYGFDPDGREIEWRTNIRNYEYLESVTIRFSPAQSQKVHFAKFTNQDEDDDDEGNEKIGKGTPDPLVQIRDNVESVITSVGALRRSIIRIAWVLGSLLIISMLAR